MTVSSPFDPLQGAIHHVRQELRPAVAPGLGLAFVRLGGAARGEVGRQLDVFVEPTQGTQALSSEGIHRNTSFLMIWKDEVNFLKVFSRGKKDVQISMFHFTMWFHWKF